MASTYPYNVQCSCGKRFSNWDTWLVHYRANIPSPRSDRPLAERKIAWQRRELYHSQHKAIEVRL